jgi:hypothetical protein
MKPAIWAKVTDRRALGQVDSGVVSQGLVRIGAEVLSPTNRRRVRLNRIYPIWTCRCLPRRLSKSSWR